MTCYLEELRSVKGDSRSSAGEYWLVSEALGVLRVEAGWRTMFKDWVGSSFLTSFTIVLSGTPSDWVLKWSRFLAEAIESEIGRRAKFIDPERKVRKTAVLQS